jgi:hypothetical protein
MSEHEYLEIVKRLIPGYYSTSTGHPGAEESFTEFVKDVIERVPELRNLEDWEVEEKAISAIDWARSNICSEVYGWEFVPEGGDYYKGSSLYVCNHPAIGRFYLVIRNEADGASGFEYFGFMLTNNYREALKEYSETKKYEVEERKLPKKYLYTYRKRGKGTLGITS